MHHSRVTLDRCKKNIQSARATCLNEMLNEDSEKRPRRCLDAIDAAGQHCYEIGWEGLGEWQRRRDTDRMVGGLYAGAF